MLMILLLLASLCMLVGNSKAKLSYKTAFCKENVTMVVCVYLPTLKLKWTNKESYKKEKGHERTQDKVLNFISNSICFSWRWKY